MRRLTSIKGLGKWAFTHIEQPVFRVFERVVTNRPTVLIILGAWGVFIIQSVMTKDTKRFLWIWSIQWGVAFLFGLMLALVTFQDWQRNINSPRDGTRRQLRILISKADSFGEFIRFLQAAAGFASAAVTVARANGYLEGDNWGLFVVFCLVAIGFGLPLVSLHRLVVRRQFSEIAAARGFEDTEHLEEADSVNADLQKRIALIEREAELERGERKT